MNYGAASNHYDSGTLVESFLYELCDSPIVKRSVTLSARRFRTLLSATGEKITDISALEQSGQLIHYFALLSLLNLGYSEITVSL
jgi:hypothetical protein